MGNPLFVGIRHREASANVTRQDVEQDLDWMTQTIAADQGVSKSSNPDLYHRLAPAMYQLWLAFNETSSLGTLDLGILFALKEHGVTPVIALEYPQDQPCWTLDASSKVRLSRRGADHERTERLARLPGPHGD